GQERARQLLGEYEYEQRRPDFGEAPFLGGGGQALAEAEALPELLQARVRLHEARLTLVRGYPLAVLDVTRQGGIGGVDAGERAVHELEERVEDRLGLDSASRREIAARPAFEG